MLMEQPWSAALLLPLHDTNGIEKSSAPRINWTARRSVVDSRLLIQYSLEYRKGGCLEHHLYYQEVIN
jgi:hypothetical protein